MEQSEKNFNTNLEDKDEKIKRKRKPTISAIKEKLGLDKIPAIHPSIPIKKDGKHLYQVAGYFYPLRPETLERLNIPNQRILYEVDRDQWIKEMMDANKGNEETHNPEQFTWGYEE